MALSKVGISNCPDVVGITFTSCMVGNCADGVCSICPDTVGTNCFGSFNCVNKFKKLGLAYVSKNCTIAYIQIRLYPFSVGSCFRKYSESCVTVLLPQTVVLSRAETYAPTSQAVSRFSLFTVCNARLRCRLIMPCTCSNSCMTGVLFISLFVVELF